MAITVFAASVALILGVLYEYFSNVQQSQLHMQTELAAQGVANEGIEYFSGLDTAGMENHLEREEVKEALAAGYGESRRYSSTLMERSLYSALALKDGTILRLSISQNSILTLLFGSRFA